MVHKVKKGENLSQIAQKYGTTVDALVKLNKIKNADYILIDLDIEIPESPLLVSRSGTSQNQKQILKSNPEVKPISKVKIGDARYVQQQLVNAGYDVGSKGVDGLWGNDSLAALNKAMSQGYKLENDILYRDFAENPTYERIPVNANWQPYKSPYTNDSTCPYGQCAEMANRLLYAYKDPNGRPYFTPDNIGGHAWTRLTNENGKLLYSGYVDSQDNSRKYTDAQLAQMGDARNAKAAERFAKTFDIRSLDPNRAYMVNMYYLGSGSTAQAWKEGKDGITGTHTGNVFYDPEKLQWLVYHNIGKKNNKGKVYGDIHVEPLETLFGVDKNPNAKKRRNYSITAISEAVPRTEEYMYRDKPDKKYTVPEQKPEEQSKKSKPWYLFWKQGGLISKKAEGGSVENEEKPKLVKKKEPTDPVEKLEHTLPEITVTNFKNRPDLGWQADKFIEGLNSSRQHMMQKYGWTDEDFTNYSKIALNLAKQESDYGRGKRYIAKAVIPDEYIQDAKLVKGVWDWAINDSKFPWTISAPSKGLTQIKFKDDVKNPALRKAYHDINVYNEELLMDPKNSAAATLVRLHHNNKDLEGRTIRYLDETEIPHAEQHGFMWNAGRLSDMKNRNIKDPEVTGYSRYVRNYINNGDYK